MTRSVRLTIVVDLAHKSEKDSANKLTACREAYEIQQLRLIELNDYYSDYDHRFKCDTNGLRADDFAAKRNFLEQLSLVVQQQKNSLVQAERALDQAKDEWQKCHLKCENLQRFVADIQRQEIRTADKLEQRSIDDWITQNHWRK